MANDKTAFDDYLKAELHRDILFRVFVWASISGLTAYYASHDRSFTTIVYLKRAADTLGPVVNAIGIAAIALSGIALVLKDLEQVAPNTWGQSTPAGRIGGVARRLAGDLSLWVVGALVTLLSAVTYAAVDAYRHGALTAGNAQAIFVMYFVFIVFLVVVAALNVFVRRAKPLLTINSPFSQMLTTAPRVIAFYLAMLSFAYFIR